MPNATPASDKLVRMPTAAALFGYRDANYFCKKVAASKGILPLRQGNRWFAWKSDVDRALAALPSASSVRATNNDNR
jgi:hypothetical protein